LCYGDDDRLVVGSRVDRADTVRTGWETIIDSSGSNTSSIGIIDTLEEDEVTRVEGVGLSDTVRELLNSEVSMSDDLTLAVKLLGSSEVVLLSVGENTGLHLLDVHLNGERSVGLDGVVVVGREDELGGGHVVEGGDITDGAGVARTFLDLLSVGDGLSNTEVNEVVGRGQGSGLASNGRVLAVVVETRGDDSRVESRRGLRVTTSSGTGSTCSSGASSTTSCSCSGIGSSILTTDGLPGRPGRNHSGENNHSRQRLSELHNDFRKGFAEDRLIEKKRK